MRSRVTLNSRPTSSRVRVRPSSRPKRSWSTRRSRSVSPSSTLSTCSLSSLCDAASDGARDRLTDPPRRVRREFVTLAVIELLDGADEPDVALLDEVEEGHPAADVFLRDRHDKSKVRLGQVVSRVVTLLDELVREATQPALLVGV